MQLGVALVSYATPMRKRGWQHDPKLPVATSRPIGSKVNRCDWRGREA